jgi:non-specific protein-tyrosine kinase
MQSVVQRIGKSADLVIFDSPPLLPVTDAAVLSSFLDGTLLVIDASHARRRVVRMGRETLTRAGARALGAVLNRVPAVTRFGYGELYGYREERASPSPGDIVAERGSASVDRSSSS